jgi:hypothetical protein
VKRLIIAVAAGLNILGACSSGAPPAPLAPSPTQQPQPQPSTVSLTGRVQGEGTGPIIGAIVVVLDGSNAGRSTTTGDGGLYRLDNLTPGRGNLLATATDYLQARAGTLIDGSNTLDFTLPRAMLWSQSGVGPQMFVVPSSVAKVGLTADFAGSCEYFQVRFQTGWIVNTNLGDCGTHHLEGTYTQHVQGGGPVQVINFAQTSGGNRPGTVVWTLVEVR